MSTVIEETTKAPEVEDQTTEEAEVEQEVEQTEPETFDRAYVEKLRDENAKYRQRAGRADDLAAALWSARVTATGRLADPTDIPMPADADPLDVDAMTAAVDALLTAKPHLASRKPRGDVGQGHGGSTAGSVDLAGILRSRA